MAVMIGQPANDIALDEGNVGKLVRDLEAELSSDEDTDRLLVLFRRGGLLESDVVPVFPRRNLTSATQDERSDVTSWYDAAEYAETVGSEFFTARSGSGDSEGEEGWMEGDKPNPFIKLMEQSLQEILQDLGFSSSDFPCDQDSH
ncbi:unnamed protein product [Cyprideis torosa]|uniref:Uncharacterized protein n=1 Tax=Cyprideis torosa TaxID=163714 RepID=A0A7R8W658_9CRUS|nr:unnamed protein product [Cyprideis torosa]CAG0880974.1 unnamed protein product [Cyprideis torosa]